MGRECYTVADVDVLSVAFRRRPRGPTGADETDEETHKVGVSTAA